MAEDVKGRRSKRKTCSRCNHARSFHPAHRGRPDEPGEKGGPCCAFGCDCPGWTQSARKKVKK